jgi:hypothetical protein
MAATTTTSAAEGTKSPPGWVDLINESVHTSDDIDIGGDIEAVSRDFIVVKQVL